MLFLILSLVLTIVFIVLFKREGGKKFYDRSGTKKTAYLILSIVFGLLTLWLVWNLITVLFVKAQLFGWLIFI